MQRDYFAHGAGAKALDDVFVLVISNALARRMWGVGGFRATLFNVFAERPDAGIEVLYTSGSLAYTFHFSSVRNPEGWLLVHLLP